MASGTDPTLVSGGTTITLKNASVQAGRDPVVAQNHLADGASMHTEHMHPGVRGIRVTCELDNAADVNQLDDWVNDGTELTFTSDTTGELTTNTLGSVLIKQFTWNRFGEQRQANLTLTEV